MASAPALKKSESVYWVRYPQDGDPWFIAEWKAEGHLLLSTSYSNHRFVRNFVDMFGQGLHIADGLRARLFEEVGAREVTRENVGALLEPNGTYMALLVKT